MPNDTAVGSEQPEKKDVCTKLKENPNIKIFA